MRGDPEEGFPLIARSTAAAVIARSTAAALAALGTALLFLASCAGVPRRAPAEWAGVLPSDATMYVSVSVPGASHLIKKALGDGGPGFKDIVSLLDSTRRLVSSVTLSPGESPGFAVVALGSYPSFFLGLRLSFNSEWTRKTAPVGGYWEWKKSGMQVSVPDNSVLLVANGELETMLGRYASPVSPRMPPEVAADMERTDLVLYLPQLPGGVGQVGGAPIPIREIWINASREQGGFQFHGTANASSEREARLLVIVLKLGVVSWMRSENLPDVAGKLKSVSVISEGLQVKLSGLFLSDEEIAPLFLSFLKGVTSLAAAGHEPIPVEPAR